MYNITSMPQSPIKNNIYFNSFRPAGATFEELCHNYTQERLQLLFHQKTITALKERYSQAKPSLLWSSAVVFFLTFTQLPSWAWWSRIIRHAARTVRLNVFTKSSVCLPFGYPFFWHISVGFRLRGNLYVAKTKYFVLIELGNGFYNNDNNTFRGKG